MRDGEYTTALGTEFADDPVLGIVENLGLGAGLTDALEMYVGILAAVILLIATNAALIGLSRLTFSMGQYRQLPEGLRQIHPKFKTPYVALIVFSGVAILVMAPGETTFLGTIYAFGATLSFTVAHVSLIRLRKLRPAEGRPKASDGSRLWLSPGNVTIRGVEVPVLAVVGGIGTFGAFVVACALDPVVLATGGGWMIVGTIGYVAYRRNQGLPLYEDGEGGAPGAARRGGARVSERRGRRSRTIRSTKRWWRRRRRSRRNAGERSTWSR